MFELGSLHVSSRKRAGGALANDTFSIHFIFKEKMQKCSCKYYTNEQKCNSKIRVVVRGRGITGPCDGGPLII